MSEHDEFLEPGGAMRGVLFARLLERWRLPATFSAGDKVGPFRIERELGEGGMGVVYLAQRVDGGFAQQVALKVVRSSVPLANIQELFRHERSLLAALDHPHIARLIDGGESADGWLWFAMEHVDGLRIDRHVHAHGLDLRARLQLFTQVCEAVSFAHQRLVIHRDIKPANILVTAQGWVKLLDFGIAALAGSASMAPRAMTPNWASPEQQRGEPVTTASDVFQLGLLLRVLVAAERAEPIDATRGAAALPASAATVLPDRELAAIADKCTTADVAMRYASVGELLADIGARLQHRPVAARGGGSAYRLRCYLRRHALGVAIACAVVAVIVAMSALFAWRIVGERNRAEAAARLAQQQSAKAASAVDFLTDLLSQADPFVNGGHPLEVQQVLEQGAARLEQELDEQPALKVELLVQFGRIYSNRDDDARAVVLFEHALRLLREYAPPNDPLRAEVAQRLAGSLPRNQNARALQLADEAARIAAANDDRQRLARLLKLKSVLTYEHGDMLGAAQLAETAVAANALAFGKESKEHADNLLNLGDFRDELGDLSAGYEALEHAYRIYLALRGPDHPDTLLAEGNLAEILRDRRDFAAADAMYADVLARTGKLYGEQSPRYAKRLNDMGLLRLHEGRLDEAEALFRRALALFGHVPVGNDLDSLSSFEGLARIALERRRFDEALALLREWEQRERSGAISVDVDDGSRQLYYARAYTGLSRWSEAETALAAARATIDARLPAQHPTRLLLQQAVDDLAKARAAAPR